MRAVKLQVRHRILAIIFALLPLLASAQHIPTISNDSDPQVEAESAGIGALSDPVPTNSFFKTIENGQQCITITFEGLRNGGPVPSIEGINSPGWLSLIDADAGGGGNFANEPSPETIMYWLGANPSIVLDHPASKVEFYYSTATTLVVTAYDENNNSITQVTRPSNYNMGSNGPSDPRGNYNKWDPLTIEVPNKKIKRLEVIGGPNYTGFENLKVCHSIRIDSAELTQAIQQWQSIDDLKADLQQDREPPVPIIAGKEAVLRVYLPYLPAVTPVTVEFSGPKTESINVSSQPQCTVEKQRLKLDGCESADFYFTPTEGNFDITVKMKVKVNDSEIRETDSQTLQFKARKTNSLTLKAVSICDNKMGVNTWLCAQASDLMGLKGVLRKIAPTANVNVVPTLHTVQLSTSSFPSVDDWWTEALRRVVNMHSQFEHSPGSSGTTVKYYGMSRPGLPGSTGGQASGIHGKGAISRTSVVRLNTETASEVVAHETGHMLGLRHTDTSVPMAAGSSPGCYSTAHDPTTDWPFENNRIQSTTRLEVGFDVSEHKPLNPQNTYDIMSYCVPRWISPQRYKMLITELSGGAVTSASAVQGPTSAAFESVWLISGRIVGESVQFDPLFSLDRGSVVSDGTHRVDVLDLAGAVLATAPFTPYVPDAESNSPKPAGPPMFSVLVPQPAGAASLVVRSPSDQVLGTINLGGIVPTVQLNSNVPSYLTGEVLLNWTITDIDSPSHTTRIHYSSDDGQTWSELGIVNTGEFLVDFDKLPGTSKARIKLMVSDGINSTSSISGPFTVAKKAGVTATILSPRDGMVVPSSNLLFLEGVGADVDDGTLTGSSLSWSSEQFGALGAGERLGVKLTPGAHTLVLKATDSDGNVSTAKVRVLVAGPAPVVDVTTQAFDSLPTTCVGATIEVTTPGLPPSLVEYSLNGGTTWTAVPLNQLPFRFVVPGSGFFHLIARTFDAAGQSTADDELFFTSNRCQRQLDLTPPVITPVVSGTRGKANWFTSAVSVSWQVNDPESGIARVEGCSPALFTTNTAGLTLTCTAFNGSGVRATASVTIQIDMTPPAIAGLPAATCSIWPPNKRLTRIAAVGATDDVSGTAPGSLSIKVNSNEPLAPSDISIADNIVRVSADRLGSGNGRIYTVIVQAADMAGNTTTATGTCSVPHDQRN
jgi:hypothetical protein